MRFPYELRVQMNLAGGLREACLELENKVHVILRRQTVSRVWDRSEVWRPSK